MVNDDAPTPRRACPTRPAGARLPPVRGDAQPAARVHEGRLRRPDPGARLEPGVRRLVAEGRRYEALAGEIERALRFMAACGIDLTRAGTSTRSTSGRATRARARLRGGPDAARLADRRLVRLLGAHALDRRADAQPDGAHVEFFAGVHNPLGVKLGPSRAGGRGRALRAAEPARVPGRLTLIVRMGAERVARRCRRSCAPCATRASVVWACDPMHGNIFRTAAGSRRGSFDDDHGRDRGVLRRLPRRGRGRAASTSSSPART